MGAYPNPGANVTGGGSGYFNNNNPYGNNLARPVDFSGYSGGPGSNQYFSGVPSMPMGQNTSIPGFNSGTALGGDQPYPKSGVSYQGGGLSLIGPQYPGLSGNFANMLNSQMGQGLPGWEGSVALPTGGFSQPGQLTAGMNPLMKQLMQFFQSGNGGNMPGLSNLANIANNGVSALPEWQSMIAAMGQNTAQNEAQLKEQFAGMGDLAGSPFATGMSNYLQQTNLDQNALLGQLQQSNIQNIQMPAINELFQGSQTMAGGLQALDQTALSNAYQQFQTDLPQNNPMLQYMAMMSSLYPQTGQSQSGASEFGAIASGFGDLMKGVGSIMHPGGGGG